MEKTEFTKLLTEKLLFDSIKDNFGINSASILRWYLKELKLTDRVDARRLYVELNNYRLKKYGNSMVFQEAQAGYYKIANDYDNKIRRSR